MKAELGEALNELEWQWLEQHHLSETINLLHQQEAYREEIRTRLKGELAELKGTRFLSNPPTFTPNLGSFLAFVLYKIDHQEMLSRQDIALVNRNYTPISDFLDYNSFINETRHFELLREKHKLGPNLVFSTKANAIAKKLDAGYKLSLEETLWFIEQVGDVWIPAFTSDFSRLQEKFHCESFDRCVNWYLILKKLEDELPLAQDDKTFLQRNNAIEILHLADVREFFRLKQKYKAEQIEESSPSHHLYKLLSKLDSGALLGEPDLNYLKKRKLDAVYSFAVERQAALITKKLMGGYELSAEDRGWCIKNNREELLFLALKHKFRVSAYHPDCSKNSPLYTLLNMLDQGKRLADEDIVWLDGAGLFKPKQPIFIRHYELEAMHAQQEYMRTRNGWFLANASSYWRKAEKPIVALTMTEPLEFDKIKENKLKSALFTTRGGALRDLDELHAAEECARSAIACYSKSHNPYTLLGALCYDMGRYDEGYYWFEEAKKRGATERDESIEIKRILQRAKDDKKRELIDFLLRKNSYRYEWVKKYAASTGRKSA